MPSVVISMVSPLPAKIILLLNKRRTIPVDRVWKAWKAMKPASHPSHPLWKSLRDSHIPTASTTGDICLLVPPQLERCCRKGLVTDVSGPQGNACPGTLTCLNNFVRCDS